MDIVIERHGGGPCSLEEFADKHGLQMEVHERSLDFPAAVRFYAHFTRVEIAKDGFLVGALGNGATPEEAIANYALCIQGCHLKHEPSFDRESWRYFDAPNEFVGR